MNSDFCVGVHALVYLDHKKCMLSSEELADNICTNRVRIRRVMGKLAKAGLVETRSGHDGGYSLNEAAGDISLENIADALDTHFVSASWQSGDVEKECLVSSGMGAIMDDILDDLDETCRKKLKDKTIADIGRQIFGNDS